MVGRIVFLSTFNSRFGDQLQREGGRDAAGGKK